MVATGLLSISHVHITITGIHSDSRRSIESGMAGIQSYALNSPVGRISNALLPDLEQDFATIV